MGAPVAVTAAGGLPLKRSISKKDVRTSFSSPDNPDDMLLFTSLYQAIEYAQSQIYGLYGYTGRGKDNKEPGTIPNVFLVAYYGSTLKFREQLISIQADKREPKSYGQTERLALIQSTEVNKGLLIPIKGIAVVNIEKFASYSNNDITDYKPKPSPSKIIQQKLHF